MIYGIDPDGEILRWGNSRRTAAKNWAQGEVFDGNFRTVEGRRLYQMPRHWTPALPCSSRGLRAQIATDAESVLE